MVTATVVMYTESAPSDRDAARHLVGPVVPTLAKLWRQTYTDLPATYYLLVHEEGAYDHGQSGPVRRMNPSAFAKGSGSVAIVCTMTDDPSAEESKYCVWKFGHGSAPVTGP